jgi:type IV pilus assembly protein PilO
MAPLIDKLQKVPTKTRAIAFGALVVVILIVYIWQIQIPMRTEIAGLRNSLTDLQRKIDENNKKIQRLGELKAEVKALQEQLAVLTDQLPPGSEVSGLLRQIQGLVNKSGLVLKLWRPEKRRTPPSGLYEEIPITLILSGGYNDTAQFFDRVSRMTRIVNIYNIRMGSAKIGRQGTPVIEINCTAMTFAAVEAKSGAKPPAKKRR